MKKTQTLKQQITTKALGLLILGLFLSFGMNVKAQKADFSGNWTFNESKSQMGEGRFRAASKMAIVQKDSALTIERTSKRMNGEESTLSEKYTFNGKVCENAGFMNTVRKSTLAWSADNKILTINSTSVFERDGNTMEIKTVEAFSLSDDGKTLTINSTSTSPRGERKQVIVYDKN